MHVHWSSWRQRRRDVFNKELLDVIRSISTSVRRGFESERGELDGKDDHVYLLVNYPSKVAGRRWWTVSKASQVAWSGKSAATALARNC
ncbi:transposase [Burkholderia lata]|uniref:transposase n=1 Tax=Burkholderia lata (strain ATCC 17760 / DSM 23089 / LMG 22485 / NCIMB 9086 / R18194 / 383) TaxID=482957 RepID=UPI0020C6C2C5|nr:transposase [Burkholderia lata]